MSVKTIPMYRVECDEDGCDASPQDDGEFWAWSDDDQAEEDARESDWIVRPDLHLCRAHGGRNVCMGDDEECPRRDELTEADDGWMYCPQHVEQGMDA